MAKVINVVAEKEEKRRKDERKKLRERRQVDAEVGLCCTHPACVFVVVNKAGLTNYTRQKHMLPLKFMCQFCNNYFIDRVFITTKDMATREDI